MSTCGSEHPYLPDENFCCKMTYWRGGQSVAVSIPEGWKGASIYQRERDHVAELQAAGIEFDRASR